MINRGVSLDNVNESDVIEIIDNNTYSLYELYGGECLWVSDPRMASMPDGTSEMTDAQFYVIERLVENFTTLATCMCSEKMEVEIQKDIDSLSAKFTIEVFELIKKKYLAKQ